MAAPCNKSCNMVAFCKNNHSVARTANHEEIFQALYEYYKYPIYNFFYSKTNYNQSTAEDLTQEAFIKAYRNLDKIKEYCNIIGWLYVIANNTLIDYQRKSQRKPLLSNTLDLDSLNLPSDDEDTPCHVLLRSDMKRKLRAIFKELPPNYYTALYLHEYENRTYAEAAAIMNLSLAAYTSLLNRARINLKEAIIAYQFKVEKNALTKSEYDSFSKWLARIQLSDDISEPIERNMQDYFNEEAASYNEAYYYDYHGLIDNYILQKYPLNKEHIAADFGMGTGIFTSKLSRYVKTVDGYDFSKEMCDIARQNFQELRVNNVVCKPLDFTDFVDSPSRYDYGYCITVLHHMTYPQKAIERITKKIKKGGGLIISDFYKHKCSELVEKKNDLWYGFTKEQFKTFLTNAGLKRVWVEVHKEFPCTFRTRSGTTVQIPTIIGGGEK